MPALDGVRACAILGVLLHHTRHDPLGRLHGFRGVWLFFVLSGFLITTLALREEDKTGALNVRAFAIRRVFRIMPLFYLALLAYVIWVCLFGMEQNQVLLQQHLLSYLLYCPEFPIFHHQFRMPFAQAWSLGIEEKFYLLWPLLAFVCLARSKHRIGVTLILLACTAYLTATTGLAQMWGSYTDILIGCLLALVMNERKAYEQLRILGRPELTWAVLALLVAVALNRLTGTQLGERLFSLVGAAARRCGTRRTACREALFDREVRRLVVERCVEPVSDQHGFPSATDGGSPADTDRDRITCHGAWPVTQKT